MRKTFLLLAFLAASVPLDGHGGDSKGSLRLVGSSADGNTVWVSVDLADDKVSQWQLDEHSPDKAILSSDDPSGSAEISFERDFTPAQLAFLWVAINQREGCQVKVQPIGSDTLSDSDKAVAAWAKCGHSVSVGVFMTGDQPAWKGMTVSSFASFIGDATEQSIQFTKMMINARLSD